MAFFLLLFLVLAVVKDLFLGKFMLYIFLLFLYCGDNTSWFSVVAKLAEIYPLPCSEVKVSVGDWYGYADPKQRAFCVGWHVVGTFKYMVVVWFVLAHYVVHYVLHV